ncbi:MAG: T9SS type A sorting domain-containing protein [Chitinophagaceae bacterium]|nr:T9SS type A sorting domain-containing protein [Chitinophagaceae bacterium]
MKQCYNLCIGLLALITASITMLPGCQQKNEKETDEYDYPNEAIQQEIEMTRDLSTGKVPWERIRSAIEQTEQAKQSSNLVAALAWIERGPNGDFTIGGNPRPNGDQTAGRIRAVMIDSLDPTHKTVWAGGVDGGLWKTTDITVSPSNWTLINDNLANLAVSAICQDPRPGFQNIMYFCTGESFGNGDAVRGIGVFKSTDAGATWNFLPSTSSYLNGTRILCDFQGNVYLGTRNTGLLRSTNGGTSWTTITPSSLGANICDLEISSTSAAGRLHVATGIFSVSGYMYTDIPATVTSGSGWTNPTTPFTTFSQRTELAISGNNLIAAPANGSYQVPTVWKSSDGGDNWTATPGQPNSGWASGQGWYSLSAAINPANPNEFIVGGLDCHKTPNGGTSWTKISTWAASSGQYVHADQHNIQWWDGGSKLLFACDGGIHYTSDGGTTIRDRNKGLRLKQFYSIAIHPTKPNFFIAGAQDNGMHRLDHPGLDSSAEVVGGDGCYAAIDQSNGNFQFGSYVYNVYRRSTNGGLNWSTPVNNQSTGRFVNPWDYDNTNFKIYACNGAGTFLRWNDPRTGSSTDVVTASAFGSGNVSAVHVSPYTANRVYFGTGIGGIIRIDNADVGTSLAGTVINSGAGMPAGYVNCVVTGSDDQHLLACFTNYGVQNIWVTSNGGTSWTAIDGNLPDMPVRWALFHPDDDTKAFIATETGVWETDLINGSSTVWNANASFPNCRTDMIKYRSGDRTIAAGTHGRGIWTATVPGASCTPATITSNPSNAAICVGNNTSFTVVAGGSAPLTYQWQLSTAGAGGPWNPVANGGVYSNAATATLNITGATAGMNAYQYRCAVTGNCAPLTATSSAGVLTVNAATIVNTNPVNATICAGANSSFSVTATGTSMTYLWQVSTNGGGSWSNLSNSAPYSNVTTTTMNITAATGGLNGNQYRCVVSSSCTPVNSNAATLAVNTAPAITSAPANSSVCAGNAASFTAAASGTGLSYQWQFSTDGGTAYNNVANGGVYSGATTATLNITGATVGITGYLYRCVVSGTCTPAATSTAGMLTVSTPITISSAPAAAFICATGTTSFSVTAAGSSPTYQWQQSINAGGSWSNITNGGIYSGATGTTLTLTGVTAGMNGYLYRAVVTGTAACGAVNSASAALTVTAQPTVSLSASPYTKLLPGKTTTITASITPTAGFTTVWTWNGAPLTVTGNTYLVDLNHLGTYTVVASIGSCVSSAASISILDSASSKLWIYPSPNDGRFTIAYYTPGASMSNKTSQTITIYGSDGRMVRNKSYEVTQPYQLHDMDLRGFGSGVYYIVLTEANGNKIKTGEVVIR